MKLPQKTRSPRLAGLVATARVDRRVGPLLDRVQAGDVVVIDHPDLDRRSAQTLVDRGVAAVVNAAPMLSGRYPHRGPQVLAEAGVVLVDRVGPDTLSRIPDGGRIRLEDGSVHVGDRLVASGRLLDPDDVEAELAAARQGLTAQLTTLTHNTAEFIRREQELLLERDGFPRLRTKVRDRAVVVVGDGPDHAEELRSLKRYLREVDPVLVGVGRGAEVLRAAGHRPDLVLVDARDPDLPAAKVLRGARDVVTTVDRGTGSRSDDRFERLGLRPVRLETAAAPADAALLLAEASGARLVIAVGLPGTLEEYLDGERAGLASGHATRLRLGPRFVDAAAVPSLYSGQLRAVHAYAVLLAGLLAVAVAVATTPVGHQWALDLWHSAAVQWAASHLHLTRGTST